jgi:hypothetical protein
MTLNKMLCWSGQNTHTYMHGNALCRYNTGCDSHNVKTYHLASKESKTLVFKYHHSVQ